MNGIFHDIKGVPLYPGDLIKTPHFIGARRKQYYLYHVVVVRDGLLWVVPTSQLEPTLKDRGGEVCLDRTGGAEWVSRSEVISGHGPGDIVSFEDRPRRKKQ